MNQNYAPHPQHQDQRGGNRERQHHYMQELMFENPPIAYGYVDTSWEAHATMMHQLQQYQRYVWFERNYRIRSCRFRLFDFLCFDVAGECCVQ